MHHDAIRTEKRRDALIIRYGESKFKKGGAKVKNQIRVQMRALGKFRLTLSKMTKIPNCQLSEFLFGQHYDTVIEAVEIKGGYNVDKAGRIKFENPFLAKKLGTSILKLAQLKKGIAVRNDDRESRKDADTFISLHQVRQLQVLCVY